MKNIKLKKVLMLFLVMCLSLSSFSAIAEVVYEENISEDTTEKYVEDDTLGDYGEGEFVDRIENEEVTTVTEEASVVLSDEEAVKQDTQDLSLGFIKCVSRNLCFVKEGKNGTNITWKSSHPGIISNEGKFIVPKKITDVTITATVSKGKYKKEKTFVATANNRSLYDVMMDFIDTMCEYGRDTEYFNPEDYKNGNAVPAMVNRVGRNTTDRRSGLFLSILNRDTLQYPAFYVEEWPRLTYNSDERGSGCEISPEVWLYEMMYDVSAMTGNDEYAEIADGVFSFMLDDLIHPSSGVLMWGRHNVYDPITGSMNAPNQYATSDAETETWAGYNEPDWGDRYAMRSPYIMDKFFELNRNSAHQSMLSWYTATLANKKDFSFSRHTYIDGSGNSSGNYMSMLNPMLYAYAWGYHYTGDPQFKEALNSLMNWVERICAWNENYVFSQEITYTSNRARQAWLSNQMAGAVYMAEVLPLVPEDIQVRMQAFIDRVTNEYMWCEPERGKKCFTSLAYLRTGQISSWGTPITVPYFYERWVQLPEGEQKEQFGKWITDWADKYAFDSLDKKLLEADYFPWDYAAEMEFMRVVYEQTRDEKYLNRLLEMADYAVYDLWEMESLLPAMTHAQKKYYESSWGSVKVAGEIWKAYFLGVENETGIHPVNEAWKKKGNITKNMWDYTTDKELYAKTKYTKEVGGKQNEE